MRCCRQNLIDWEYVGDALTARPSWIADDVGMWVPDSQHFNGQYYLYYTAPWTDVPGGGSAIGVLMAPHLAGPWTASGGPVVEPHDADCCPGARRWVFDASIVTDESGQRWISYGSYFGGTWTHRLGAHARIGLVSMGGADFTAEFDYVRVYRLHS
ncbi:MAG TPA: family 43 glycosylhydrolase [Roseiflexaceae bacterium]|nr:family 43 glycosylhydrolase [Roseiflexaceae bacterium]